MLTSPTSDVVRGALSDATGWNGGGYIAALDQALMSITPNFETECYRDAFREKATDRNWFASLLASNLYMEGYSAGRLKQYAGVVADERLRRDLMRHAQDEARHSREFLNLLTLIFPQVLGTPDHAAAEASVIDLDAITPCPPGYPSPPPDEILNSMILMNLFEIKALYLVGHLKPFAMAHAPTASAGEIGHKVERIAADECHHIAYTARHLDAFVLEMGSDHVADLMAGFIEQMNGSDDFHL